MSMNRTTEGECVACGMPLISPKDAMLGMCTQCLKESKESAQAAIKGRKNRTGQVKRIKLTVPKFMVTDRAKKK